MEVATKGPHDCALLLWLVFLLCKGVLFDFYTYSKNGVPKCYLSSDDGESWTGEISETCRVHKLMEFAMFSHDVMAVTLVSGTIKWRPFWHVTPNQSEGG